MTGSTEHLRVRRHRALVRQAMARTALATVLALLTAAFLVDPAWLDLVADDLGVGRPWLLAVTVGVLATLVSTVAAALAWRRVADES